MKTSKNIFTYRLLYVLAGFFMLVVWAISFNQKHHPQHRAAYYSHALHLDSIGYKDSLFNVRENLVTFARTLKGKGYRYAAKGPERFDCSGFIYYVYQQFDIPLSPSSRAQAEAGVIISLDEVRKGDILLFKSDTPGIDRVGHVGMVTSRDSTGITFIHSSTSQGVIETLLEESPHYLGRYQGARDMLSPYIM